MARALGLTTAAPRRFLSHSKGLDGEGSPTDRWV
jgi:hypothetical protein